jgi:hypothetical protein
VATVELELEDLQPIMGEHLRAAEEHKTRPRSVDILILKIFFEGDKKVLFLNIVV